MPANSTTPPTGNATMPAAAAPPVPAPDPSQCGTLDGAFAAIQQIIFAGHGCTAQTCHGDAKSGGLDLRPDVAYSNLVDTRATGSALARVQPGTATESYLYAKLRAATEPGSVEIAGSPMPVGAPALSKDELAAVQLWIQKGAPEQGEVIDAVNAVDVGKLLGACLPAPMPINVKPLEAPATDEGIQFLLPSYVLKAGSEIEQCTPFAYDFSDKVPASFKDTTRNVIFVDGTRIRQDPQSHHLVLYDYGTDLLDVTATSEWSCREGAHDGQPCDPRKGSADCGDAGVCAGAGTPGPGCFGAGPLFSIPTQIANTQAPQSYLPPIPDVYSEIPLHGVLYFDSHAFNLLDQDTTLHARVNFYFAGERKRLLSPVNVIDNISIADGQPPFTRKTYCASYEVPQGNSITLLTGHTHRRGEHFWALDASGAMIYENFVYNDPLYKRFDPWLTFDSADPAQRTLKYCATYNNGLGEGDVPDTSLVTRASRMPSGTSCTPVACVAGKVTARCSRNTDCDSAAGAGDGSCDACPITAGTTTENEMFVLMPWVAAPATGN